MARYTSLRDMIDGGGKGKSGDTFEGGIFSDFLNRAGVRPMGYASRQSQASVAPPPLRSSASVPAPRPASAGLSPLEMFGGEPPVSRPRAPTPAGTPLSAVPGFFSPPPQTNALGSAPRAIAYNPANSVMTHDGNPGVRRVAGRGNVGMPLPPFIRDQKAIEAIEMLRRAGLISM